MSTPAITPADTHAIVVGIEKYDVSDDWSLNGPALDAARFVQWLRDRQVPEANIKLFASPLAENQGALQNLDVPSHPADSKTIIDALTDDLSKRRGELLLVMWGGHGVIGEGARRLFFSDAKANNLRNLNVSKALEFFRSSLMPGFSRQAVFLDSCANFFELQQSQVDLADVSVPPGLPRNTPQFVLFAAGPGERAKNLTALRKGLFSSIVLEELKKTAAAEWPPDFNAAETRVNQQFDALRAAGKASQTPVHFAFRDWKGNEGDRYFSNQPVLGLAERDVAEALLACPIMATQSSRLKLLGELRTIGIQAAEPILPIPDKRVHIETMVAIFARSKDLGLLISRVLKQDEKGEHLNRLSRVRLEFEQHLFDHPTTIQLRGLLEPLSLQQRDVLRIFRECARDLTLGADVESQRSYPLLMTLAGFPKKSEGFPYPALLFAEKISLLVPEIANALRDIVDQIAAQRDVTAEIRNFRFGTAWQSTDGTATLVFEMRPKAGGFVLRSSMLDPDGHWTTLPTDDAPVTEVVARDKFRELVLQAELQATRLVIEMALPREMLCWPVDRWLIDVGGFAVAVGTQYPVVLRWVERLRDERLRKRWGDKWESIRTSTNKPLWLQRTDEYQPSRLLAILGEKPASGAFITFAFPPSRAPEPRGDALTVALSGGTPVAVWLRECDPDPALAKRDLEALLTHQNLAELPDVLRLVRNQAEQTSDPKHPGYHVSVLFDNHDHRPPRLAG